MIPVADPGAVDVTFRVAKQPLCDGAPLGPVPVATRNAFGYPIAGPTTYTVPVLRPDLTVLASGTITVTP